MSKIATTKDLQTELRQLLAAAEAPNPSRGKLSADLMALAMKVAAKRDDESQFLYKEYQKDVAGLHKAVAKVQGKLQALDDVVSQFVSAFDSEDEVRTKKLAMQVYSKASAIKDLVEFDIIGKVSSID